MRIVGLGGTLRPHSTTETALRTALQAAGECPNVEISVVAGPELPRDIYDPTSKKRSPAAASMLEQIRESDGLIIASPGYHGTVSGLVKNALDYIEDLRLAPRPYLDNIPVGCISVAYGWQAAVSTLGTLRDITHALRGWPTPLGVAVNASDGSLRDGRCHSDTLRQKLDHVGLQVTQLSVAGHNRPTLSDAESH